MTRVIRSLPMIVLLVAVASLSWGAERVVKVKRDAFLDRPLLVTVEGSTTKGTSLVQLSTFELAQFFVRNEPTASVYWVAPNDSSGVLSIQIPDPSSRNKGVSDFVVVTVRRFDSRYNVIGGFYYNRVRLNQDELVITLMNIAEAVRAQGGPRSTSLR